MNWKFTLVLVAIVAVFYVFFDFYENKRPGTADLKEHETRVFALDRNQIDGLTINKHDQKIDLARGANNKWSLKAPLADRADQSLIDEVMTNLEVLRWQDNIPGKDAGKGKLADFGLQPPREKLTITDHGGHGTELLFGNDTVLDGRNYLQLSGTENVYVVPDTLKKLLDKNVDAWRDHRLTDISATDVTRMVLKNAAGEIDLQRDGEHWKLVRPLMARADDARVKDVVSQLTNLEIGSFVADDKADSATYGLAEPKNTVTLYTANDPKGTELFIGNSVPATKAATGTEGTTPDKEKPIQSVYTRMSSRQSVYTVPGSVNGLFAAKPSDLRDHSLVRINEDLVDRIHLLPVGGTPITLVRKDKAWTILDGPAIGQPVDSALVGKIFSALTSDNIADFVADSAADPSRYGLDKPLLQIKLASFASENTAESTAGERPVASVSFGKGNDSVVYARVGDEPSVATVPKALVDQFPSDALAWQAPTIFQADPAKVNSLEVTTKVHPPLNLTRPENGVWTAADKSAGTLSTTKLDALISTLARLRATRWEGPALPEYGLDKPAVILKFGTADVKVGGRLLLSEISSTGMIHAQVDSKPGAFTISQSDYATLTAELVPTTPATPEPVATIPSPAATAAPAAVPDPTVPMPTTPSAAPVATPEPLMSATTPTPSATPTLSATPEQTPEPTPVSTPSEPATSSPENTVQPPPSDAPLSTPGDIPSPIATPS